MKYRDNFDHLGEPYATPWRVVDLVSCVFLMGVVFALIMGVLG